MKDNHKHIKKTHELSSRLVVDCLFLGKISDIVDVVFGPYFGQHLIGLALGSGAQRAVTPLGKCHFSIPIGVSSGEELIT
jgi:hypothetical protein